MKNKKNHRELLEEIYSEAQSMLKKGKGTPVIAGLNDDERQLLESIASHSETNKGVLTVLITSLVHKIFDSKQDIRKHQSNMRGGYSGRTLDTRFITPFMQANNFPAMAESGWLTRSLEQNKPYDFKYPGQITPEELRKPFLTLLDNVQNQSVKPRDYLLYLFQFLILLRDQHKIEISRSKHHAKFSVAQIIDLVKQHFYYDYHVGGAARLPVLAIYSAYECMMGEVKRFEGKKLLPLEKHNSPDTRSGMPGDVVVANGESFFEAVEVKFGIDMTAQLVEYAYSKFRKYPIERFYLLSTAGIDKNDGDKIKEIIGSVAKEHGCQIIVNGVIDTLKYYLRLLSNPELFVKNYAKNVLADQDLKSEHKAALKQLLEAKS